MNLDDIALKLAHDSKFRWYGVSTDLIEFARRLVIELAKH